MKKKIGILIAGAAFALASCGTMSYTSSSGQRFTDGIYSRPATEDSQKLIAAKAETDELVQRTRESEIFLNTEITDGHRTDTLYIPEDKSAVINFSGTGTSVTITDDPFDQTYYSIYPWTYYRPVTFRSMFWDPWYYGRYWGYYDPWYWGGWAYDPWYRGWGFGFIFDPWYYDPWFWGPACRPWYPHYCGWYGSWGPGLGWHGPGHVHGGHGRDVFFGHSGATGMHGTISSARPRNQYTSSIRTDGNTRTPVNRRGFSTTSSTSRRTASGIRTSGTGGSSYSSSSTARRVAGNRTGIVSTDRLVSKPAAGTSAGQSSSYVSGSRRSVQSYRGTSAGTKAASATAGQSNWRRPANSYNRSSASSYNDRTASYGRSSSYVRGSSGTTYNRNSSSSSFGRNTSAFGRQSSYNRSSSSVSRSSSFSGSRSSGYSGGSRSTGGGSSSVRHR